ncbi:hypothetical protein [Bacillus sp. WP8]|nr:hypothetical protein [Bacillus sp. WP8]
MLELGNLIEIERSCYEWFVDEGVREMFEDIWGIEDFSGKFCVELID